MAPAFRFRADLESLPAYVPGQRPPAGMAAFKLSSNENPFPPSAAVISAVVDAAADLNRYPDMAAGQLVEALAGSLGVSPDRVAVGNGSVAVLETVLTAACAPGDEVVYPWRSFEAYPIAVQVAGATGVPVPLTDDGRHDLPAMAAAITDRTRVVLVCSPNNPTGTALPPLDVLVHVGDNIQDFPDQTQQIRTAAPSAYEQFGRTWFLLPNPMYGSWERNEPR